MNRKTISLLLVFVMVLSLFPMAALADDDQTVQAEEAVPAPEVTYAESPYAPGPKGDEDAAVIVYGKSMADAIHKSGYSFSDFVNALKSELQGILANEKLPDVEMYLVSDDGYEYKLTKDAVEDAAFLSSFQYHANGLLGWTEYVADFVKLAFGWLVSGIDTIGQFYKIYGVTDIPEGDYNLEIRKINGSGYTLWQPESGQCRVHVGDSHVNYVGFDQQLGSYTFNINIDLWLFEIDVDVFDVEFSLPGVFLNTEEPGFKFKSADFGGNALPGTEFVLVNRDETEKIVNAALKMGKETFTNAMQLIGTDGFTWEELSILNKELLTWDSDAQQISFNEKQAYKLLCTYWSLVEASARMPMTDLLSDETDIRLPAILKATADENGCVNFTEDSNVTLTWSLEILLKLGNVVLTEAEDMNFTEGVFEDPETEAIVNFVLALAKYAAEKGTEFWDENGELITDVINDWVYPVLQNDNVMQAAHDAIIWYYDGEEIPETVQTILDMMPTHALLTPKLPDGHYILFETKVPDGYIRSPLFYTINLQWNTDSQDVRDWCYVTVGNLGIILPYYAEDYYTYLRQFSLAGAADGILNAISGGETGTIIQDTLNGNADITALSIAYNADILYNYMGGNAVYASEEELAKALTDYLYTYGRTSQNLMMFGSKVVKEAKSVVTSEIDENWSFYTSSTSLRTNLALKLKAIIKGVADSIDTSGSSKLNAGTKDTLNKIADSIDTSNRIVDITTAIHDKIQDTVKSVAVSIGQAVLKVTAKVSKTILKWGMKY